MLNSIVNFEISKVLKEKGWYKGTLCYYFEDGEFRENSIKDKYFFTVENEKQEKVKFNTLISLCNYLNVSRKKFDKQFKKINTINFKNLTIKKQKYERLEK